MTWEVELWDGKVDVMGGDVDIDKFLRITGKMREEILTPLTGDII